jgi:hypothetical protein
VQKEHGITSKKRWIFLIERVFLNDALGAGTGNREDDVDKDEDGAEGAPNNIEGISTEVASSDETVLRATTSRSEAMGGGNSVSTAGGTDGGTP